MYFSGGIRSNESPTHRFENRRDVQLIQSERHRAQQSIEMRGRVFKALSIYDQQFIDVVNEFDTVLGILIAVFVTAR